MPAASRLSVTSVSCKSIKNCLYFTRGRIKRRFISYRFKKCVRACVWQRVKIILETDFSAGSFLKVVLLELTAPPSPWHGSCSCGWGCRGRLFPQAEPRSGCSPLYSSTKTHVPAPGTLLKPYLHPSDIYVALLCFCKTWFLSQSPKLKLGLQVP